MIGSGSGVDRQSLSGLLLAFTLLACSASLSADCGDQALLPSEVQGEGETSPLAGQNVTVTGVITLDSRQPGGWRGFYLQQSDDRSDHNPHTSDALFVYTERPGGSPGTRVRVTGKVKEYHGLTELTGISRLVTCGQAAIPEPALVRLPWPEGKPPEQLENMRVRFAEPLTLVGPYNFARYGELILAAQPQIIPTEWVTPGPEAMAVTTDQTLNRVHLDDNQSTRNPRPLPWPGHLLAEGRPVRAGDRVGGLTGILDYRFGHWRLQPETRPTLAGQSGRPDAPGRPAAANIRIVAFNLGNFFNGDGTGNDIAGGRGAGNQSQLMAQKSRLVAAINRLEPDILAVVEMENDHYGADSAVAELAATLGPNWKYIQTPGETGSDAIRTDLLYRADQVRPVGEPRRLTHGFYSRMGRPPVAQHFRPAASPEAAVIRIVVPHFKSKACGGARGRNQDRQDGQGCYAHRRLEEARALSDWLRTLPEPEPFAGTLVTGDLNSYAREWPLTHLREAGLTNLVRARQSCVANDCPSTTFRYQGRQGTLDYALGSARLMDHVLDAGTWAINAAEFPVLGYQGPVPLAADAPWRSSDHNPVYTDLAL